MGDSCLRQTPACEPRQKDRSQTDSLWYGRSLSEAGFTGRKVIVYRTKGDSLQDESDSLRDASETARPATDRIGVFRLKV